MPTDDRVEAIHRHLDEHPEDATARMVLADRLEELGADAECPDCGGGGDICADHRSATWGPCHACHGSGRVPGPAVLAEGFDVNYPRLKPGACPGVT